MPRPARAWRGRRARSAPPKLTAPPRSGRWPMTVRMRLVLPAPLRPTRPTMLPGASSREKPRSAWTEAMVTWTASIFSMRSSRAAGDVPAHALVGEHRRRRSVGEHASAVERHHALGVAGHDLHVVLDEEDRGARAGRRIARLSPRLLAAQGAHDRVHHRKFLLHAHAAGRLVQH